MAWFPSDLMRVPLVTGAYTTRSIIAACQRVVNLYAEKNPADSLTPFTWYNTPGLTALGYNPNVPARCLYWANNEALYYVAGPNVFFVPPSWVPVFLGTLNTSSGIVSMADNGTTIVIVDGSSDGWQIDMSSNTMTPISAANNSPPATSVYAFYGADRVYVIDGFLLFNRPGGFRDFYSTYVNEVVFDSLWFALKNGYSDNLVTLIVSRREIWLLGQRTSEIWYNSGDGTPPFQIIPGPFIQHGCLAKHSVAQVNGAVFWLAQDQAGHAQVVRAEGYIAKPISNPAMENEFASYPRLDDAEGFCFTLNGHTFYQLNFPTADKTWRWDETTPDIWHEAVYTDADGAEHRHRAACAAWAYGVNVCADWETGELYKFDMENHTDNGMPMTFRRGYPHMMQDGRQVIYPGFTLDVQAATSVGTYDPPGPFPLLTGPNGVDSSPSIDAGPVESGLLAGPAPVSTAPLVWLRWSDDRGRTWSNPLPQSLGAQGQYLQQPQWNRLGRARDRVFEVYGNVPAKLAISGAFLDPAPIPLNN